MFDRVVTQVGVLPLDELMPALLAEISSLLGVERVGYYRMAPDGTAILLDLQYLLSSGECERKPLRLTAEDYPGYFCALQEKSNLVVSHDVMKDPRLLEFQKSYFKPLGITSMLDAPVHRSGKLFGVICLEHVGPKREWTSLEVDLARSTGHLVALAVETQERKQVEEELRQALEREKELVELKTNFVNLVSHEFRTPLGVIYSASEILQTYFDRLKPEQRADHLEDICHATRQMSNLMEEVLLVGKVESQQMTCRADALDLPAICQRIVEEQKSGISRERIIHLEMAGTDGAALGDEGLLRHIFGNLLSNALKYSPAGSAVHFSVARKGAFAEFQIEDKGIGIDEADQRHLFIAFHRGRNAGDYPGTGLGLVIVKRCVELHGGTISYDSEIGKGTRFTVRFELFKTAPGRKLRIAKS